MLHKRAKGNIGENIACQFLIKKGFKIADRNYLKRWGELDIVAAKDNVTHFFEVKSIVGQFAGSIGYTSNIHKPEDNVDGWKIRKLRRIIETYLAEKGSAGLETPFQCHVLCVYMNTIKRTARIKWLKNVIL